MGNLLRGNPPDVLADAAAKWRAISIGEGVWYKNYADDNLGGSWTDLYDTRVQNSYNIENPHANIDEVIIIDKAIDGEDVWGLYQDQFS